MSKAVLISIKPEWCELITNGMKTVEIRKTAPKIDAPFKCYIYCTNGADLLYRSASTSEIHITAKRQADILKGNGHSVLNGKVIGEFVCDEIRTEWEVADGLVDIVLEMQSCVDCKELIEYADGKKLYSWNISNLVIYDKPKELNEFKKHNRHCHYEHLGLATPKCSECKECQLERPPQSWCYVEEIPS